MIYLTGNEEMIFLPRTDRCKYDPCHIYQLLLQNKATKEVTLYKLQDEHYKNPIHYGFRFYIPDWLEHGEYDLYLLSNNDWSNNEINPDRPVNTFRYTEKGAIDSGSGFLVFDGYLLVTENFKGKMVDSTGEIVESGMDSIVMETKSCDERVTGELINVINIIHTDLLKYKPEGGATYVEPQLSRTRGKYKEYKRII